MAEKLETRIRQEQIVQAALALIAGEGLGRLSIARVARRVRVVPSALYRHFPNKDAIVDATLRAVQQRLLENVRAARGEASSAVEQLHGLFARHVSLITGNPGIPRLVFSDELFTGHNRRGGRMFQSIERYLAEVARIVRDGQRRREFRPDVDAAAAAMLFLGLVQVAGVLSRLGGDDFDTGARAEKAWAVFVAGIER
jgi:AcrR family transcriptional regulator